MYVKKITVIQHARGAYTRN